MKTTLLSTLTLALILSFQYESLSQEIWGMTKYGGTYQKGVIFKMDENGSNREVVFSFETVRSPEGGMTEYEEGVFYGMSAAGGKYDYGIIYQFEAATGGFTKLVDFNGKENGKDGAGKMYHAKDGKFYGMTVNGGNYDNGIIFKFDPVTHEFVKLFDFDGSYTGSEPLGNLIQGSDGRFYGMTSMGGEYDAGVIFSYDSSTNEFLKLFDFNDNESGTHPMGGLTEFREGVFYGMTRWGGNNDHGVIFKIMPAEQAYEVVFHFNGEETGRNPHGNLTEATDGKLYGLTPFGGSYNQGALFEYDAVTGAFDVKYEFTGGAESGSHPYGSLVEAANGRLYGLVDPYYQYGDALFEYDPVSDICEIAGAPEVYPREMQSRPNSLIFASNGNLYFGFTGTMNDIKNINYLYEYNPSDGKYEKHFTYSGIATGDFPHGNLLQAEDGMLYGVTYTGGKYDYGTIFRFDPVDYTLEKILDFEAKTIGSRPNAGLVQGNNLKLYGTTTRGGAFDQGVLFELDATTGKCIKLTDFSDTNGKHPEGPLVEAANGRLYGITTMGGEFNQGVLFEFDTGNGTFKKLLDFEGDHTGGQPFPNSLVAHLNGRIYGTTSKGGMYDQGVLFEYSTESGDYITVIDFQENNLNFCPSNLTTGNDNALHGYSERGSSVFTFNPDDKSYSVTELEFDEGYIHVLSGKLLHASSGKLYAMDSGVIWFRATDFTGGIFEIDLEAKTASQVLEFQEVSGSNPVNGGLIQLKNLAVPVVRCNKVTVYLDENGHAALEPAAVDNVSTGDGIELTLSKSEFSCEDIGETSIILTGTDANGNTASCTSVVTVADTIAPVAVCRDIEVFLDASGNAVIDVTDVENGSSDACGMESATLNVMNFTCENIGENTVELTVTDINGNTSVCTAAVTVYDTIAPVVICRDIEVSPDASGKVGIEAADIDNGSHDACGIASMTLDIDSFTCGDVGENTVELTISDNNGNTSSCRAVVTVTDNLAPVISCTGTYSEYLQPYWETYIAEGAALDAQVADNCDIETFEFTVIGTSDSRGISLAGFSMMAGEHEIEWQAADGAGNSSSCISVIEIKKRPTTLVILDMEFDQETSEVHIEAMLRDDLLGNGIEGKTIAIAVDTTTATAITDDEGVARVVLSVEDAINENYVLSATFGEDNTYIGSEAEDEVATGIYLVKSSFVTVYPNPFIEKLYFEFTATESADARIDLFDAAGRLVKNVFDQPVTAGGFYKVEYRPHHMNSSFLLYRVKLGTNVHNGKVMSGQ